MQTKTVRKVVKNKMDKWLSTIANEELRSRVEDNLLVSGGCIASLLLQEGVNDFDVYIMDQDVLRDLGDYYAPGQTLDGRLRDDYLRDWLGEREFKLGDVDEDYKAEAYVKLRTLKPEQIKMDVGAWGEKGDLDKDSDGNPYPYQVAFISQNAISLTDDLQIVTRFSGTQEEIHKNFDFIHATNYYTTKDGLVLNQPALESLLTKQLQYQGSMYPMTSIIRMKKFVIRGWKIGAGEMLKIMFQISKLNLEDADTLEEQLIGVDVAYFGLLIRMIREGEVGDQGYEAFLRKAIDRAFDSDDLA